MRSPYLLSVLLLFVWLPCGLANAQCADTPDSGCNPIVPHLVRFNGTLKGLAGQSDFVGVTFSIYADSTGGTPLWQEVQNVRLDRIGRYAVLLGMTTQEGVPPSLFSSGQPRWLGVQAQMQGEQEQARLLLASVPYALAASDAQTLGGLPPSAFLKSPAYSGEGAPSTGGSISSSTGQVLGVGVAPRADAAGQAVTTPGGTAHTVPVFSSATSIGGSQIKDTNGVVSMRNLANTLYADQFPGGVPDAIAACPATGCVINAVSQNVNLNLGSIDPGSKAVTLYLGPYTYTVSQIMLRRELQVIGMGSGITFLQSVNGNNPVIVSPQSTNGVAANVFLSGFRLIGSANNTSEDAIFLDSSGFFNSGVWYSEIRDIFITGFAGIGVHIVGTDANFSGISQFIEFNRVIDFRVRGGGNGLRIEGAAYEMYFNDCEFDGQAAGDGTNIYIGARPGNTYGIPIDINFRGLTSQLAATAVQIDGGWAVTFNNSHHEFVWGAYSIDGNLAASIAGVTISDTGFQTSGTNNGAGYLLSVTAPRALGIRFVHNNIMGPADTVVRSANLAGIVFEDNLFAGGTNLPVTTGLTTHLAAASTITIGGAHTVGLDTSSTPVSTIQGSMGAGETVTFIALNGPVKFAAGGNIDLKGSGIVTVTGSITFVVSDLGMAPMWIPVSLWNGSPIAAFPPIPVKPIPTPIPALPSR